MLPGAPNCVHCALRRGATADPGDWNGVLSPAPPGTGLKSRRGRIGSTCFLYFFLLLWGWSWNGGRMRPHATRDFIRDMVTHNYEGAAGLMVYPNTEPPAAVVASLQARWQAYEAAHGPSNTPILLGQTFTNIHTWTNYYLLPFKNGGAGGAGIHFVRYHGINTVRALILYDTNADMPAPTSQVQD